MKYLIMFLLRVIFLPFFLLCLLGTYLIEFMKVDKDWKFWGEYNQVIIDLLPWAKYK